MRRDLTRRPGFPVDDAGPVLSPHRRLRACYKPGQAAAGVEEWTCDARFERCPVPHSHSLATSSVSRVAIPVRSVASFSLEERENICFSKEVKILVAPFLTPALLGEFEAAGFVLSCGRGSSKSQRLIKTDGSGDARLKASARRGS